MTNMFCNIYNSGNDFLFYGINLKEVYRRIISIAVVFSKMLVINNY